MPALKKAADTEYLRKNFVLPGSRRTPRNAESGAYSQSLARLARAAFFLSGITAASVGFAEEQSLGRILLSEAALREAERRGESYTQFHRQQAEPARTAAETKSYVIPAMGIVTFSFLLNRINSLIGDDYDVSLSSIKRNLRSSWVIDRDPFAINQLGHPYQGSVYYGLARSAGLNFWESFGYTFAGSTLWEVAGETTAPSRNDQFTTTFAGTFLGESLFRMANLVLERPDTSYGAWREWMAAAISPPTAFNRATFPSRFGHIFSSQNPATSSRLRLGIRSTLETAPHNSTDLTNNEAVVDFAMHYGLPGKPGYAYHRPFDYFSFQISASSARAVESVNNYGLIVGKSYEAGPDYRGVWGLYGNYDYLSPQLFQLSSTALSLGTTGQWWLSKSIAVQGTATAGVGYTSIRTLPDIEDGENDYHYGFAPQAMLALRVIFGNAASFDVTARKYFAGDAAQSDRIKNDQVFRADASFTVRIHRNHAIALKYITARRDSVFQSGDRSQRRDTIGIYYTLLGSGGFGTVNW